MATLLDSPASENPFRDLMPSVGTPDSSPKDYGDFADLVAAGDPAPQTAEAASESIPSPNQLIGGGTADAPAFQIVGQNFSDVPRGVAVSTTDYGPFSDLVEKPLPPIINYAEQFGIFGDLVPKVAPETEKAVVETPLLSAGQIDASDAMTAGNILKGLYEKFGNTPLLQVPKEAVQAAARFMFPNISAELQPIAKEFKTVRAAEEGLSQSAGQTLTSLTTPQNIAIIAATGSAPAAIQKAISLGFSGYAAYQMGQEIGNAVNEKDPSKFFEHVGNAVTQGAFMTLAGLHGITPESAAIPPRQTETPVRPASAPEAAPVSLERRLPLPSQEVPAASEASASAPEPAPAGDVAEPNFVRPAGYTPAIQAPNGEIFTGPGHEEAFTKQVQDLRGRGQGAQAGRRGFVDASGNFLTLMQVARREAMKGQPGFDERGIPAATARPEVSTTAERSIELPRPVETTLSKAEDYLSKGNFDMARAAAHSSGVGPIFGEKFTPDIQQEINRRVAAIDQAVKARVSTTAAESAATSQPGERGGAKPTAAPADVGAAVPTLRPGENQGDLLSKQQEDLTLVGQQGVDYGARQTAAEQTAQAAEEARLQQEHEQEALFDFQQHQQASGDELLIAIEKSGGLPSSTNPYYAANKGEIDFLRETSQGGAGAKGTFLGKLFKKNAPSPDDLTTSLRDRGFDLQTPGDLFEALHVRFKSGKAVYPSIDFVPGTELGATAPGTGRTSLLIAAGGRMVRDLADTIGGKVLPKLTRTGVMDEAVQHTAARQYVPALVQDLQAKVFPTKYKNLDAMAKTVDVIKADNILGGYDDAVKELEALRQAEKPSAAKIADQEEFVKNIEQSQNLDLLDAKVRGAKGTDIEADIHRWEQHVTPLMDQLYNEIKGADPNAPRETRGRHYGARMNLLPVSEAAKLADFADPNQPLPEIAVSNYRNPNVKRDRFMRQAKLTGEYSSDPNLVLLNSFGGRWNEVTKQRFYQALEKQGVAQISEPGGPSITEINGKPAARMPIKMPETNPETGRTQMVERSLFVQKDLVNEIRNVLNTDGRLMQNKFFQALTQVQLFQLADATAHLKNIHSVTVNALGNTALGKDLLRKVPGLGTGTAVTEITRVSRQIAADSPAIRTEIAEMTKRGMVRPEYPVTGVQKLTRMQKLIHDVDTASRVIMNRRFDNLVKRGLAKDTIENRRNFVQQIGEYNRRLMSRQEAWLRDYGVSPFIVAGRTFNRFSRRLVTGAPGFEARSGGAAVAARAAQVSGLVFATTLPAIINMFTTGSMGGRAGTPVGAIDFGPGYDTEEGKRRVLDIFQLVGIRRGLRGTGMEAAIEGFRNGDTPNDIAGKAAEGVISTSLHPYIGPGLGGAVQTLTGKRLDLRTGWKVDVPQARKIGGFAQLAENFRVALRTQNPFIYGIVQNGLETGMDKVFGIPPEEDAPSALEQTGSGLVKSALSAVGYKEMKPPGETGTTITRRTSLSRPALRKQHIR